MVDPRMESLLILINALFYIERVFLQEDDQSPEHRLEFRKEWSEPIVDRIMEMLKKCVRRVANMGRWFIEP